MCDTLSPIRKGELLEKEYSKKSINSRLANAINIVEYWERIRQRSDTLSPNRNGVSYWISVDAMRDIGMSEDTKSNGLSSRR